MTTRKLTITGKQINEVIIALALQYKMLDTSYKLQIGQDGTVQVELTGSTYREGQVVSLVVMAPIITW